MTRFGVMKLLKLLEELIVGSVAQHRVSPLKGTNPSRLANDFFGNQNAIAMVGARLSR